jgi:histidine triad (HIT) family protein
VGGIATHSDCLFCKIAHGEVSADIVQATDNVVAFRDVRPAAPTHVLLIPKEHIHSAAELTDDHGELLVEIFQVATHVAKTEGIGESGWRLVTNVGPDAGQSVFHVHFHLLGGRGMDWPPG